MATMTGFKVYKGTKAAFIAAGLATSQANSIVFITGGNDAKGSCIFAQGTYFATFKEFLASVNYVKGVNVGGASYNAAEGGGYIAFEASDPSTVNINAGQNGISIGLNETFVNKVNTIWGDYLTASDKDALETAIAKVKSDLLGDAIADTKNSKTIEGVIKYVDSKTANIATDAEINAVSLRVEAIEKDYLVEADKTELANSIKGISDDYLKKADKDVLSKRITDEAPVTMSEAEGSGNILKSYTFTQNGKTIGTINLAKELVVTGGQIVEVNGVKYLELTIANQTEKVRIAVTDLVDVYTAGSYITINANNVISVDRQGIIAGLATDANAQQYAKDAEDAAKGYADGLAKNYATAEQGRKADGAAPQATTYTKSEVDALVEGVDVSDQLANYYTKSQTYSKAEVDAMFAWEEFS